MVIPVVIIVSGSFFSRLPGTPLIPTVQALSGEGWQHDTSTATVRPNNDVTDQLLHGIPYESCGAHTIYTMV